MMMLCGNVIDGERRRGLTQACLDQIGQRRFMVALRRHRHQRGGELEEVLGGNLEDARR